MYHHLVVVAALVSALLHLCSSAVIYPVSLQTQAGSVSTVRLPALHVRDQTGSQDSWDNYVEFYGSNIYQGIFTFVAPQATVVSYTLNVNYKGPQKSNQKWTFEVLDVSTNTWVFVGDNSAAPSWTWVYMTYPGVTVFPRILTSDNVIQVRLTSSLGDDCDLDYLAIITADVTGSTIAPTAVPAPTRPPTSTPTLNPTLAPAPKATSAPTASPQPKATPAATRAPTPVPTRAPTPAATRGPTPAPTRAPTQAPVATAAPTNPPSSTSRLCPAGKIWAPAPGTTWQWQLIGTIDQSFDVQMYDIDLFDVSASVIASLHQKGRAVICYFSTQYENWRPDAASFPASILGNNLDDWPGERYVDIRSPILRDIMKKRLDLAVSKGCDGVEPDNVDGYTNANGLQLTAQDQLNYNKFLAHEAHARGLSIGLKNDLDQVQALQPYFDWALNEQCNQYGECNTLKPFVQAGKAVFGVEYSGSATSFCPTMVTNQFSWLLKDLDLKAPIRAQCCPAGGCKKAAYQCVDPNLTTRSESLRSDVVVLAEAPHEEEEAVHSSSSRVGGPSTLVGGGIVALTLLALLVL